MSLDPNAFESEPTQPQSSGSNPWKIIIIVIAIAGVLGIVVCCGGGYFAATKGMSMMGEMIAGPLKQNEVIIEKIGPDAKFNMSIAGMQAVSQANPGAEILVFDATGSNGSGQLHITMDDSNKQQPVITTAKLVMPDGEEIELLEEGETLPIAPAPGG